jgi:hypothetical protein
MACLSVTTRRRVPVLLAALVILVSGCGDDQEGGSSGKSTQQQGAASEPPVPLMGYRIPEEYFGRGYAKRLEDQFSAWLDRQHGLQADDVYCLWSAAEFFVCTAEDAKSGSKVIYEVYYDGESRVVDVQPVT